MIVLFLLHDVTITSHHVSFFGANELICRMVYVTGALSFFEVVFRGLFFVFSCRMIVNRNIREADSELVHTPQRSHSFRHCEARSNLTQTQQCSLDVVAGKPNKNYIYNPKTTTMNKGGFVYIMSSPNRTTLYTGVSSDLTGRVWQHRNKIHPNSFSAKYNCVMLVYYSHFDGIEYAIAEEKRIKAGSRKQKDELIIGMNPNWLDLWDSLV
jgi:putative endonuclease